VSTTAAAKHAELAPVASPSLSDVIYRQLCERLMRGQLKPDQRLKIRDLAWPWG
jgi:Transcriptional regulators